MGLPVNESNATPGPSSFPGRSVTPPIASDDDILLKPIITVIHCWTAPRSRSTALLYSFEARGKDCCVAIDEPLKREWLIHQGDKVVRPYKFNMIEGVPPADRPEEETHLWERELLSLPERIHEAAKTLVAAGGPPEEEEEEEDDLVIFCKHMSKTHFLFDFEDSGSMQVPEATLVHQHMFLIRDPTDMLRSWDFLGDVHNNSCSTDDVGIVPLLSIFNKVRQKGKQVTIVDTDVLVKDPEAVISTLCRDLGVSYRAGSMMTWDAGTHECDSRHAHWWYPNAHLSTGWLRSSSSTATVQPIGEGRSPKTINPKLLPALRESLPAYQLLSQYRAIASSSSSSSSSSSQL